MSDLVTVPKDPWLDTTKPEHVASTAAQIKAKEFMPRMAEEVGTRSRKQSHPTKPSKSLALR